MTLSIYDILYHKEPLYERAASDIREGFSDLAAAAELGVQLLAVQHHPDFDKLVPHLRLLDKGEASQATKAGHGDQAANKIFELLAACYSMRCGSDVDLDDPDKSSGGKNPDVLVTMAGQRWGVACKVLHSLHPESIVENVRKGLDQIDASPAETGFLFFNLKNVVNRERYWSVTNEEEWNGGASPRFTAFATFEEPEALYKAEMAGIARIMVNHIGHEELQRLFEGKRAIPGILFYAHVLCGVVMDGYPVVTSVRFPAWAGLQAVGADPVPEPLNCFHDVMQAIPGG